MADRARDRARKLDPRNAEDILTASAQILQATARESYAITYRNWQDELWNYADAVGEFGSVLNWYASGVSRMHLRAGVWKPGLREPELLDKGRAAEIVNELVSNVEGGETQFLSSAAKHLFVPGVAFFVAEEVNGVRTYDIKSADVIKRSTKKGRDGQELYMIRTAPDRWRTLSEDSLVGRIFTPDPRYDYLPTSMSRHALTTLREIDLYNRHIVATLLSRIAFNGFLLIPAEVTFPVNRQFKDAPDPFIAELLHYASRGIKDPGSPGSAIPFPLRVPAQFVEHFKHLIVASGIDPKVIDALEAARKKLAEQLPAPPEALSGIDDMNHWNAWKSSEDSVKMYFGPTMETFCGGMTKLFLHPMMKAEKEPIVLPDGGRIVMWYDASDLTVQPDNSENARDAADRGWVSREAYLNATGMDPDDIPKVDDKLREQILVSLASKGTPIPDSYYLLFPKDKPDPATAAAEAAASKGIAPGAEGLPQTGPSGGSSAPGTPEKKRPAAKENTP